MSSSKPWVSSTTLILGGAIGGFFLGKYVATLVFNRQRYKLPLFKISSFFVPSVLNFLEFQLEFEKNEFSYLYSSTPKVFSKGDPPIVKSARDLHEKMLHFCDDDLVCF